MRTITITCFLVLLLPWELYGATTLSPSTLNQYEGSAESHGPPSRSEEPTISFKSDQPTTKLRPEDGVSSSKWPTHFPHSQNIIGTSHAEQKTTEVQTTKEENVSRSSSFSQATSKGQTKRSLEYSTKAQESTILAKRDHNQNTTLPQSAEISQGNMTSIIHEERKTTVVQITMGESNSPSHSSSLITSRRHTKRSLITSENNRTTSTPAKLDVMDITITENNQTSEEVKPTEKSSITGNLQQNISRSTEKVVSKQTNTTSQVQTTEDVITAKPEKVSVDHQTKVQTTAWSTKAPEIGDTKSTTSTTGHELPKATTKSGNNISEVTSKAPINLSVLPIFTSTTKATFVASTSMASTGLSTNSSTGPATGPVTGSLTTSSTGPTTASSTGPTTGKTVTTSMPTSGKMSTATPLTSLTTQPAKTTDTKKVLPVTPESQDQNNAKKTNAGSIVAALIGTALVLMFIAIAVILLRKRRMQKRQLENSDWAGPSPFLESEIQPNPSKQANDGLFQTKRLSLHSFLPQRLSQRLSLLVEEDVEMNDMVAVSTFGKNEQAQNGKPTMQQDQVKDQGEDQDKAQNQTEAQTPDVVSSAPGAPETVIITTAPDVNGTIQPTSTPGEEIPPPTETSTALPTPPPFDEIDLSVPQTNAENTLPAPQP